MIITAIEPRRKRLSALYIDGEFAINLDTETLIINHFTIGKEIDDEMLHDVINKSNIKRCKDKALYLIEFRDHSRKELFDKLKKDYPEDIIEDTLNKLEDLGLINDEAFAKKYATDLFNLKHLSKNGVTQQLKLKGIDKEIIYDVINDFDIDEKESIELIINKKYKNNITDEKAYRRAFNALLRKGYNYSDIKSVMEKILNNIEE